MAEEQGAPGACEVSVVVPVCNVERYVGQCLESLSAQTLQGMEILLVDDGSTDACPRLLAQAAERDPRMRVVSKPNGGYGSAVNVGFDQARGRYVGIVEPDDVVDARMFEELLAAARLADGSWADVVKSSYWNYYDLPGEQPYIDPPNLMGCMPSTRFTGTAREEFEVLLHHPSVWSAIYRRGFLQERGIRMMEVPGGGWVDNPFFFETLLQAERFVWEPAAYYYYRQTNPSSSSNMKNYHLPFDRLRDLRRLFERLHVDDPQLIACLYARHFFYIGSVIGEWGFSERDPELRALIREAMEALDPEVLYGGHKGITRDYLAFYESIMGDKTQGVPRREKAAAVPQASVVVPSCNDRDVLAGTLSDLARQSLEDIEVVCVDCVSEDLSADIAAAFAAKDARFRCLSVEAADYAQGIEAGLAAANAPAVAVVLPGSAVPNRHLETVAGALAQGADMAVCVRPGTRPFALIQDKEGAGVFEAEGRNAELLLYAAEGISGCALNADFVRSAGLHVEPGDEEGLVFLLEAVCAARRVWVGQGKAPAARKGRRRFAKASEKSDLDVFQDHRRVLDAAYEAALARGEDAVRAARCLAVRRMLDDARLFIASTHAQQIHEQLREDFRAKYGLAQAPLRSFCNVNAYQSLQRALMAPYQSTLQREVARVRGANNTLHQRCASIKGSGSYRLGNALVRAGRKVLPTALRRRLSE